MRGRVHRKAGRFGYFLLLRYIVGDFLVSIGAFGPQATFPESFAMQAVETSVTTELAVLTSTKLNRSRYLALDAYRGFIMLLLASEGFGFSELRDNPNWGRVARWFNHVPWEGGVFWDMIQP